MNAGVFGPIARATLRELRNGIRRDPRQRATFLFALAVSGTLGLASTLRLGRAVRHWEGLEAGGAEWRLWLVCASTWLAAAAMAWIGYRERSFGDRARLALTLPLGPAVRARGQVLESALHLAGGFGLSLLGVAVALVRSLGLRSLPWIALLAAGCCAALGSAFLLQMAWMAAGRSRAALGALAFAALALAFGAWRLIGAGGAGASGGGTALPPPPSPWIGLALALVVLALGAGPGAAVAGRLYELAFFRQEAGTDRSRPHLLLRRLTRPLRPWRGPTGALLVREVLLRGRQGLEWLRLAMFASALFLLFPWLRPLLAARGLAGPLGLLAMLAATALFYVLDGSSSPLGAEGSRLALYLSAPIPPRALLRAKVAVLFLPLGLGGLAGALLLGRRGGLEWGEILWTEGAASLVLLGLAALFALGSAWDADLELEIEPGLRGLVQETAPITTLRMGLFILASLLAAGEIAALRLMRLEGWGGAGGGIGSLLALAALDLALLAVLTPPAERALLRRRRA